MISAAMGACASGPPAQGHPRHSQNAKGGHVPSVIAEADTAAVVGEIQDRSTPPTMAKSRSRAGTGARKGGRVWFRSPTRTVGTSRADFRSWFFRARR